MTKVVLAIVAGLLAVNTANADELALDCNVNILTSNLPFFFQLHIDDNGLAYTSMGETTYYTNEDNKFFRKNDYEIKWGDKRYTTSVINRSTGEYKSFLGGDLWESGVCTKGNAQAVPKKF